MKKLTEEQKQVRKLAREKLAYEKAKRACRVSSGSLDRYLSQGPRGEAANDAMERDLGMEDSSDDGVDFE